MLQKEKNERSYVWQEFPRASSSCRRTTLKSTAIFVLVLWGVRPLDWRLNGASFVVSQDIWWNGWWRCYLRFRLYILNGISFLLPSEGAFFPSPWGTAVGRGVARAQLRVCWLVRSLRLGNPWHKISHAIIFLRVPHTPNTTLSYSQEKLKFFIEPGERRTSLKPKTKKVYIYNVWRLHKICLSFHCLAQGIFTFVTSRS